MRAVCLILSLILLNAAVFAVEVENASVGQVGEHVVTAREVWVSSFLERWNLSRKSKDASARAAKPDWKPDLKTEAFNQTASNYMLEVMVAKEAENFSVAQVDPALVQKEAGEFLQAVKDSTDWKRFEVTEKELKDFIDRKYRARNFMKFKTESAGLSVSEDEAKAYYERNRLKFGNLPYPQFRDSIKEVLTKKALEDRLKDWFEVLRRKYRVRFLGQID